jgi:hypothetical protein
VDIFHRGVNVYSKTADARFYIGQPGEPESPREDAIIEMGTDITGEGIPNLVVSEWTLGAHCCFQFYIFELGEQVRLLTQIDAGHAGYSHFVDIDDDGIVEFTTHDSTFAYWNYSFAHSPAPAVILRLVNEQYLLAIDAMFQPLPSQDEIRKEVEYIRQDTYWWNEWGQPPPDMWNFMLRLIYSGHEDAAYAFFEDAWLPEIMSKNDFLEEFRIRLTQSPYWLQLLELNRRYDHTF